MPDSLFDLTGRVAIVTGAARGLGRAIALGLARHGADVGVIDRDEAAAVSGVVAEIEALGRRVVYARCDVSNQPDVDAAVAKVSSELGPVGILVNNAGITKRIPLADWTELHWREVIDVNQVGTFLMSRAVGTAMAERRGGSIVNVSALGGGIVGLGRGNAVYCSTKGAIAGLTRDLAAEWARHGVRVNAIAPGWFRTEMNAPLLNNPEFLGRIIERVPVGRLGEPEDVVGAVVFLASDASAMITGHLLPIDGGASSIIALSSASVIR